MAGRGAFLTTGEAMSEIRSTRGSENNAGISGSDTSAIGGAGRKGASGHGSLDEPMWTRIDSQVMSKSLNGMATGGVTGYDFGYGRTFGSGGSKRKED